MIKGTNYSTTGLVNGKSSYEYYGTGTLKRNEAWTYFVYNGSYNDYYLSEQQYSETGKILRDSAAQDATNNFSDLSNNWNQCTKYSYDNTDRKLKVDYFESNATYDFEYTIYSIYNNLSQQRPTKDSLVTKVILVAQ